MWTMPLMRTVARVPIFAPLKMVAPVARKTLSATSQPVRYARGPTSTLSPMRTGLRLSPRITAVSMMTQFAPISIGPLSAVRTAPKPIELFGPIVTSPQTTAVGATRADGWMRGATPLWSRSIIVSYSSHRSPAAVSQCAKDEERAAAQYHRVEPEARERYQRARYHLGSSTGMPADWPARQM